MHIQSNAFKASAVLCAICMLAFFGYLAVNTFWVGDWGQNTSYGLKRPTDSALIGIFETHRATFERIQQMADADIRQAWELNLPGFEGSNPSSPRRRKYDDLLSEIGSGVDVSTENNGSVRFDFAGVGTTAIGPDWSKGIEYLPGGSVIHGSVYLRYKTNGVPRLQCVGDARSNLDVASKLPADVYMRQIAPNWFLFYQRDD
jgi:hypothetical protein